MAYTTLYNKSNWILSWIYNNKLGIFKYYRDTAEITEESYNLQFLLFLL